MEEQDPRLSSLEQICFRLHCEIGDLFPPLEQDE
ncbi:MAG: hypothetical protein ETSY2_24065 [Candidatus Entotheonella gemina]|uniref:Uncharacterized protein n=1 Tax=Candidatus Entotheonella gemina TaxID=1429439 RepID=W4M4X8_9BACT|nr:MAG: hypothetical protein ETSY2_24065 [Candidatus Entotheonella gemina]